MRDRLVRPGVLVVLLMAANGLIGVSSAHSQADLTSRVQEAVSDLPYYGVFDVLGFKVHGDTVTVGGYAYNHDLTERVEGSLSAIDGVSVVVNNIELLARTTVSDDIRWGVYRAIYSDRLLRRYGPQDPRVGDPTFSGPGSGSAFGSPAGEPVGPFAIHIVVKGREVLLVGQVLSEDDRELAGFHAGHTPRVDAVVNRLTVAE